MSDWNVNTQPPTGSTLTIIYDDYAEACRICHHFSELGWPAWITTSTIRSPALI